MGFSAPCDDGQSQQRSDGRLPGRVGIQERLTLTEAMLSVRSDCDGESKASVGERSEGREGGI